MMRTFNPQPAEVLCRMRRSKAEHFSHLSFQHDYALPQGWLNGFAEWCRDNGYDEVSYDLIRSTTVWGYAPEFGSCGRPVTCCTEVERAYNAMERSVLA